MPGHEILSSEEIEADLLKVAEDLSKEADWKNKLLAPALGLGMALSPGAAKAQPAPQAQTQTQQAPAKAPAQAQQPQQKQDPYSLDATVAYINKNLGEGKVSVKGANLTFQFTGDGTYIAHASITVDLSKSNDLTEYSDGLGIWAEDALVQYKGVDGHSYRDVFVAPYNPRQIMIETGNSLGFTPEGFFLPVKGGKVKVEEMINAINHLHRLVTKKPTPEADPFAKPVD